MACKSGYLPIKMDEESISLTTFSAPQKHYGEVVMPFDLQNAP